MRQHLVPAVLLLTLLSLALTWGASRSGAGETGHNTKIYTHQGGATQTFESGATLNAEAGSTVSLGGAVNLAVATLSTTTTLTAATSGATYIVTAEDTTTTLPAVASGLSYRFHVGSIAGATGVIIHPAGTAKLYGNGFTAADGKGAKCTHATARAGDFISMICDGTDWWITSISGTWAREP